MPKSSLSSVEVAALRSPGLHRVERGLYLQVTHDDAKSWILRYQLGGRPRSMGLGPLRLVSLSEARGRALRAQRQLLDGFDPIDLRRDAAVKERPSALTFADCAREYITSHERGWKNAKHRYQWSQSLSTYAYPTIGGLPVDRIAAADIYRLLSAIWSTKNETATRVRGRIERILDWAKTRGLRQGENPAKWTGNLSHLLPAPSRVQAVEHHAALPYERLPNLCRQLAGDERASRRALLFVIATAARSGEARGLREIEVDRQRRVWVVPPERMKGGKEHRVPLSDLAITCLPSVKPNHLVFVGANLSSPLSDMTLIKALRSYEPEFTVHGLRSSFRDWAAEQTDFARECPSSDDLAQLGASISGVSGSSVG